ncbi:hypothetical protein MMC16_004731 [Acarospora aff. strigata]|nr:hypothetical protein [Acarospora aff. strigata]
MLYHDVLLTNSNLEAFVKRLNVSRGHLVRSLTICIYAVQPEMQPGDPNPYAFLEDQAYMMRHGNQGSKRLWGSLRDIVGKVASMIRLMTFSFYISPEPYHGIGFWIPRPIVATIIKALPETCVNLEIDTRGLDYLEPGSAHLCEAVRGTLPHLRNLRLRLSTLCPAIFGADFDPSDPAKFFPSFQPVGALALQTVVINCIPFTIYASQASICGTYHETLYNNVTRRDAEAEIAFVVSLRLGVERGCYPAAKCLRVIFSLPHGNHDASVYATLIRRDILENQTLALPFRNITDSQRDSYLIRTLEGQEIFSYAWAIQALAEGPTWRETTDGYRLPATLLGTESTIYVVKSLPFRSTEEWKANNPRRHCTLWSNETICECRLLDAERREGLTDLTRIREKTPAGWHRVCNGSDLEQDES